MVGGMSDAQEKENLEKVKAEEETALVSKIKRRVSYYERRYAKAITLADEDMSYFRGKQTWTKTMLDQMRNAEGQLTKPALVLNQVRRYINFLRGRQSETRFYFKVIPEDNVNPQEQVQFDQEVLTIDQLSSRLTEELKKVESQNDGEYEIADAFLEAIAGHGRSYIEVFVKRDETDYPYKEQVMFEHRLARHCYPDPDSIKADLSDSNDFIKVGEISREDLKSMFPDKEEDIDKLNAMRTDLFRGDTMDDDNELDYKQDDLLSIQSENTDSEEMEDKPLTLIEYYDYEWKEEYVVVTNSGEAPQRVEKAKGREVKKILEQQRLMMPGFEYGMFRVKQKCWYLNSYCDGVLLGREKLMVNGRELTRLPFAPLIPDRVKGIEEISLRDISVTRETKGAQDMFNKSMSLLVSHLASSTHSGIVSEEGALKDPAHWEEFGSSPGFHGEVKQGKWDKWKQLFPTNLSAGHLDLMRIAEDQMQKLLNINPDLIGAQEGNDKSGRAIALRQQAGTTGNAYIFDAIRRMEHLLASLILEQVCALKGVPFKGLKVVIDDTAESPTARYANFMETKELFESGILNSPYGDMVIDSMNINNREGWKQRFAEVNEFMQWKQQMAMKQEAEQLAMQDAQKELQQGGVA